MADLATLERALRNADAAGDTEGATRLAAAYRAAQGGQPKAAPAPETPKPVSQGLGFAQGLGDAVDNAATMVSKIPVVGPALDKLSTMTGLPTTAEAVQQHHAAAANATETPGGLGRFAGGALATLPIAAAAPGGLFGTLASGAASGAVTADPNHKAEGALLGAGGGAVLHGLGAMLQPVIAPAVQRLAQAGVRLTPGQAFQGTAKKLEDRFAGMPFVENSIGAAKNDSLRTFGTAAGNEALSPMGAGVIPAGVSGQAMSQTAHDAFDNSYGSILPNLNSVTLDPNVGSTVANNSATLRARMPDGVADQFDSGISDIFKKLYSPSPAAPTNTFPGQNVKDVMVDLGAMSRQHTIPTSGVNDRAIGNAYGDVRGALRGSVNSSDPVLGPQLQATDAAYKGFIPVDRAVRAATGNANGLEAGVFTPRQLRSSVLATDGSARGNAASQGQLPLQQLAEDGVQILPSSVADSGTAGRLTLADMLAQLIRNPVGAAAMALPAVVSGAAYSRPVISGVTRLAANGGTGPGATALGQLMQQLGRYGAGPAAGTLTGGGK